MDEVCQRLGILLAMYLGNKNSFRDHAHGELTFQQGENSKTMHLDFFTAK